MLRKLSLAIAISGLLVASIPSTVAASTWTLSPWGSANCPAETATAVVSWTGGHGHWISYTLLGSLKINNTFVMPGYKKTFSRVATAPGHAAVPDVFDWSSMSLASGTQVRVYLSVQLLRGGQQTVIGTFDGGILYEECTIP